MVSSTLHIHLGVCSYITSKMESSISCGVDACAILEAFPSLLTKWRFCFSGDFVVVQLRHRPQDRLLINGLQLLLGSDGGGEPGGSMPLV